MKKFNSIASITLALVTLATSACGGDEATPPNITIQLPNITFPATQPDVNVEVTITTTMTTTTTTEMDMPTLSEELDAACPEGDIIPELINDEPREYHRQQEARLMSLRLTACNTTTLNTHGLNTMSVVYITRLVNNTEGRGVSNQTRGDVTLDVSLTIAKGDSLVISYYGQISNDVQYRRYGILLPLSSMHGVRVEDRKEARIGGNVRVLHQTIEVVRFADDPCAVPGRKVVVEDLGFPQPIVGSNSQDVLFVAFNLRACEAIDFNGASWYHTSMAGSNFQLWNNDGTPVVRNMEMQLGSSAGGIITFGPWQMGVYTPNPSNGNGTVQMYGNGPLRHLEADEVVPVTIRGDIQIQNPNAQGAISISMIGYNFGEDVDSNSVSFLPTTVPISYVAIQNP